MIRTRASAAGVAVVASAIGGAAFAQPLAVSYVSTSAVPATAVDGAGQSITVTGLSGLVYAGGTRWLAVMDNSNRVIELNVVLGPSGSVVSAGITAVYTLAQTLDFEDIAVVEGAPGEVWLAEETTPAVRRYDLASGALLEVLAAPAPLPAIRPNFGFESLTAPARPGVMWTCNEEALTVDGPLSTPTAGTLIRLAKFVRSGAAYAPAAQYAYRTNPIHAPVTSGSRSGVSALVQLPSGALLPMERSLGFNIFAPFQTRIYEVDLSGAVDVSSNASFGATPPAAVVGKRLLYSGSHANVEGLALGPELSGGGFSLLGIVDDGDPISVNQLVAWRLTGAVRPDCPADWNLDAGVDGDDVIAFFGDWDQSLADFDGSGGTDGDDVIAFFGRWDAGC